MASIDRIIMNYLSNNLAYPIVQDLAAVDTPTPYIKFEWQLGRTSHHFQKNNGCNEFTNNMYDVVITIVTSDTDTEDPTEIFVEVKSLMHGKTYPSPGINKTMVTNTKRPPKNTTFNKHYEQLACSVFVNESVTI